MNRASCIMKKDGVTLVELIIVLAIIGIVAALATLSVSWLTRETRVSESRDRLLADIEDVKLKSLAQVPHGIIVNSDKKGYKMAKLNDTNNNFKKDTTPSPGETYSDIANSTVNLQTNYLLEITGGDELWFDRKGVPRTSGWNPLGRTVRLWYDEEVGGVRNGVIDWTDKTPINGVLDRESECKEPCKLIIISDNGRIQYEKR